MTPRPKKDGLRRFESLEDKAILQFASYYCSLSSGNILSTGEILAIPEISGYKRLVKRRGSDVRFIVNGSGLEALLKSNEMLLEKRSHPESKADWYSAQKDGREAVFFHNVMLFDKQSS